VGFLENGGRHRMFKLRLKLNTLKFNRITHMEVHPFLFYSEVTRWEVTD
jgi:hypothetical protein